jgi:hypothetical protein
VYLSPQTAGFDVDFQYAPNTSNGEGISSNNIARLVNSLSGSGIGTGNTCVVASAGCPTLSSGPGIQDGSRDVNQTTVGVRYQGTLSRVGILAYAVYEVTDHAHFTGIATASALGNSVAGSQFNGQFDGPSFGNGGLGPHSRRADGRRQISSAGGSTDNLASCRSMVQARSPTWPAPSTSLAC